MAKRRFSFIILWVIVLLLATPAAATERQGWYAGADIGIALPETLKTRSSDSDVISNCDQWLDTKTINGTVLPFPPNSEECQERDVNWTNSFNLGNGLLAGLNFGYAWRSFRVEVEYLHREHSGEKKGGVQDPSALGYKSVEFVEASEIISDVSADHFFGNLYYDFHDLFPKVIPYVGVGAGVTKTSMELSGKYLRNPSREYFTNLPSDKDGPKHPDLAGTDTLYDDDLSDVLFGYQFMAGIDYALTDHLFVGVKARYADVGGNFSQRNAYDRLRSHGSTVCPPQNAPTGCPTGARNDINYRLETDALSFWGVSLNLKYFFQ